MPGELGDRDVEVVVDGGDVRVELDLELGEALTQPMQLGLRLGIEAVTGPVELAQGVLEQLRLGPGQRRGPGVAENARTRS